MAVLGALMQIGKEVQVTARLLLLSPLPPSLYTHTPNSSLGKLSCVLSDTQGGTWGDWRYYDHIDPGRPMNPGEEKYCTETEDAGKGEPNKGANSVYQNETEGAGPILALSL